MAKYRPVLSAIWSDPDFEDYSKDQKLIFLYLITSEKTTESGVYAVSPKAISNETGVPIPSVKEVLGNGFKNVSYDFENRCVFIHNFLRYNGRGRKDLLVKSIQADVSRIRTPLWDKFQEIYPRYSEGVSFPPSDSPSSISTSISIDAFEKASPAVSQDLKTEKKNRHLEYVYLTAQEYDRLCGDFGKAVIDSKIEDVDNYIGQNPQARAKKYKDHNRTIRAWLKRDGIQVGKRATEKIHCSSCGQSHEPHVVEREGWKCPACGVDLKQRRAFA